MSDSSPSLLQHIMDPGSTPHRYIALTLICLLGFGNYFCYDTPGALEIPIEDAMSVTTSQFTSLNALYSWPNVVICFIGGLLIDKVLGIRLGAIVFLALLVLGQLMVSLGAFSGLFWLMQLGRFVYGLGGESLSVAQNTYVVCWFNGRELNTVFGFQITVSRAGSALAYNTMHRVFNHARASYSPQAALGYTLLLAGSTCVLSFIASIILALLDKRAERILARPSIQTEENATSIKDAAKFKSEFWMLALICVAFYLTIFPFISIASKFFQTKWNYDSSKADAAASAVYIMSAVLSPFIGLAVDKLGRNLVFLLVASILVTFAHFTLATTLINLWIPIIALGLGYSIMCSALWPLVPLVVPQHQLGTAYGVIQAVQNFGLATTSNLTGVLIDWKGYINVELFFVLWVAISVIITMILIVQDNQRGGLLNKTASERKNLELLHE